MKVVSLVPKTGSLIVTVVESEMAGYVVSFVDEWSLKSADRFEDYRVIRARLVEHIEGWAPDAVVVGGLEPFMLSPGSKARPTMAWFETAELRGVVCEAARSVCGDTAQQLNAETNKTVGSKKKQEYERDEAFWNTNFTTKVLVKYRPAILVAVSKLRGP